MLLQNSLPGSLLERASQAISLAHISGSDALTQFHRPPTRALDCEHENRRREIGWNDALYPITFLRHSQITSFRRSHPTEKLQDLSTGKHRTSFQQTFAKDKKPQPPHYVRYPGSHQSQTGRCERTRTLKPPPSPPPYRRHARTHVKLPRVCCIAKQPLANRDSSLAI